MLLNNQDTSPQNIIYFIHFFIFYIKCALQDNIL